MKTSTTDTMKKKTVEIVELVDFDVCQNAYNKTMKVNQARQSSNGRYRQQGKKGNQSKYW
jgi:hypothetical protein